MSVNQRLQKLESQLKLDEPPKVLEIVHYGDELPEDETQGNIHIKYVKYEDLVARRQLH